MSSNLSTDLKLNFKKKTHKTHLLSQKYHRQKLLPIKNKKQLSHAFYNLLTNLIVKYIFIDFRKFL